jgi:hypothetical protein
MSECSNEYVLDIEESSLIGVEFMGVVL